MLRLVLDTNVLVSAILYDGKPRRLFQRGIDGEYKILTSRETLDELYLVLCRPKFRMTREEIIQVISALMDTAENVSVISNFKVIKKDPDDNIIINTAHDGHADYIVSGDKDLIGLKNFHKIRIIPVNEMLKILE